MCACVGSVLYIASRPSALFMLFVSFVLFNIFIQKREMCIILMLVTMMLFFLSCFIPNIHVSLTFFMQDVFFSFTAEGHFVCQVFVP